MLKFLTQLTVVTAASISLTVGFMLIFGDFTVCGKPPGLGALFLGAIAGSIVIIGSTVSVLQTLR
jgi:hypothetical protein